MAYDRMYVRHVKVSDLLPELSDCVIHRIPDRIHYIQPLYVL